MRKNIGKAIGLTMSALMIFGCGMAVSAGSNGSTDVKSVTQKEESSTDKVKSVYISHGNFQYGSYL